MNEVQKQCDDWFTEPEQSQAWFRLASLIPIPQVTYTMGSSSGVASSAIDTSYM